MVKRLILCVVLTLITGFKFFTKEKVVDIGKVEITADKPHKVAWSPLFGIGVMVVGGILYLAGGRRAI